MILICFDSHYPAGREKTHQCGYQARCNANRCKATIIVISIHPHLSQNHLLSWETSSQVIQAKHAHDHDPDHHHHHNHHHHHKYCRMYNKTNTDYTQKTIRIT